MLHDYKIICNIGKGSFSTVYKAQHKISQENIAIKVISLKLLEKYKERILAELSIIKKLDHDNILSFKEIYQSTNNIYILSELCDGTLTKIIKTFYMSENEIHKVFKQIIQGIKYLYDNKIFHRDIKPDNILIKDDKIKIADFGFAKEIDKYNLVMNTLCGSPLYMAPEIILNKPYDINSDIWSLGIILYEMMYKKHPYNDVNSILKLINNFNSNISISFPNLNYSKELLSLVSNMLIQNPKNRMEWEILFEHEWLNKRVADSFSNTIILGTVGTEISEFDLLFGNNSSTKSESDSILGDSQKISNSKNNSKSVDPPVNQFNYTKSEPINIVKSNSSRESRESYEIPRTESYKLKIGSHDVEIKEDYFYNAVNAVDGKDVMNTAREVNTTNKSTSNITHTISSDPYPKKEILNTNKNTFFSFIKNPFEYFSL